MTADTLRTLERIGSKPGTTHRDLLIITRRIVRHLCELRSAIRSERHSLSRQANKLRQSGPFTQRRAYALEQQARGHRAEELASVVYVLEDYGRVLMLDREGYARGLGFGTSTAWTGSAHAGPDGSDWSIWLPSRGWRTAPSGVAIAGSSTARSNLRACWHWASCTPVRRVNCPSGERLAVSASARLWLFTMPAVRVWWSGRRELDEHE